MTTLLGIIVTAITSHIGGSVLGGILARYGVLGFGRKIGIAKTVLQIGKAYAAKHRAERTEKSRKDLADWLKQNDPNNESGLKGDL